MVERLNSSQLNQLLSYNPVTGVLTWRFRSREWFQTLNAFRRWNTMFANKQAFTNIDEDGYLRSKICNIDYKAHQVIWCMCFGYYPPMVDHEDGNRRNNILINLRQATPVQNARNTKRPKHNTSTVTGVCWHNKINKWWARISHQQKRIDLGFYDNFDDAVAARKNAEVRYGYHANHGRI